VAISGAVIGSEPQKNSVFCPILEETGRFLLPVTRSLANYTEICSSIVAQLYGNKAEMGIGNAGAVTLIKRLAL
jgi:hypothetical protein